MFIYIRVTLHLKKKLFCFQLLVCCPLGLVVGALHKNEEALGLIGSSMSPKIYVHIGTCTKAYEAWDKLKTIYDSSNESRKIQLQDQLEDLRYSDFKSMDDFLLRFDYLNSQLHGLGLKLEDLILIHLILKKCLPR